jgi:hypothetical protein
VIPTEDTVSVEQYEKAASPGSVLHMLVYTAYKKQLQLPPDQVNSPVVSVFRNHWPPKFQYPNESLPAEVSAGTKVNALVSGKPLFVNTLSIPPEVLIAATLLGYCCIDRPSSGVRS